MYDCEICGVKLNGETIREAHLKGAKHQKKVKAAEQMSIADQDPAVVKTEANNIFSCRICDIILNSQTQLKAHLDGAKHQTKAAQAGLQPKKTTESGLQMTSISISATPLPAAPASSGANKGQESALKPELYCAQCDVHANSDVQYQQHITSLKHLNKIKTNPAAPKPGKAKPYGRSHFTNNGYSDPGHNNYNGAGYNNGYSGPGYNNGYSGPGYNNGYSGPVNNNNGFRGARPKRPRGAGNNGYRFNNPYSYNDGFPRSTGGAQIYPAGYNANNFVKGAHLPSMSTFFPRAGNV